MTIIQDLEAAQQSARHTEECRDKAEACLDEINRINRALHYLITKNHRPWWARKAIVTPNYLFDR